MFHIHQLWQILATVIISLGLMSDGMQFAWMSPAREYLESNTTIIKGYNAGIGTAIQVIFLVGGIVFTPLVIFLVDKIGRKFTNIIGSCLNLLAWIIIAITTHAEMLCVAKELASISYCFDMVTIPMYVSEISDKLIRGFLLGYVYLSAMFGIIVIYSIFPFVPVAVSSAVGGMLHVIHLSTFVFFPDTPYFLVMKNKPEKSIKSLKFFRGTLDTTAEMAEIEAAIEMQRQQKGKLKDVLRDTANRRALFVSSILNAFVGVGCLSVITMNLHHILKGNLVIISEKYTSIAFSVTLFFAQLGCMFVVDKFGRKPLLLFSSVGCCVFLFIFTSYFACKKYNCVGFWASYDYIKWLPEIIICCYAIAYRFGLGPIPAALAAELFPMNYKAIGMSVAFIIMTVFDSVSVYIYKSLDSVLGPHLPLYIFISALIFSIPFILFFVPETKNKTLEEIQISMRVKKFVVKEKAGQEGSSDAAK